MAVKLSKLLFVLPKETLEKIKVNSFKSSALVPLSQAGMTVDIAINNLRIDSRELLNGDLFFAYQGVSLDSRKYIIDAINIGAAAILFDSVNYNLDDEIIDLAKNKNVVLVDIPNLKKYISLIAGEFYNHPSYSLNTFAITGTNGKTTCSYLLAQAFYYLSNTKVGIIGTTGYGEIGSILDNTSNFEKLTNTTPGPILLQHLLFKFKQQGCQSVCLEASSHALHQHRLSGININTAIFTNISHDHLDYHPTIEDYYLAKKKLFLFKSVKNIVINIDDEYGERLLNELLHELSNHLEAVDDTSANHKNIILYGFDQQKLASYNLPYVCYSNGKIIYNSGNNNLKEFDCKTKLIGRFNIYNVLAVIATTITNNYSIEKISQLLPRLKPALGRMEVFHCKNKNVDLIVDYAHTPDALEKALLALADNKVDVNSKTWCVFGCGGDRDKHKRPIMGGIAAKFSDKVIITDDNPRTESSVNIIDEIKKGIKSEHENKVFAIISNRREAIKYALDNARSGDKILIAGKGHEDYQICGTEILNYNEREYVEQLIK